MNATIIALLFIAIIAGVSGTACAEAVRFKSTEAMFDAGPLMLTGELIKPAGNGPFPAIVLMHGCVGKTKRQKDWANEFAGWGYVALIVDSFGPRGVREVCTDSGSMSSAYASKRVRDAYDARAYLVGLPFVDAKRIAVVGWSHGGHTVLETLRREAADPFQVGVAFYPYCEFIKDFNAPLLILVGDLDDWTPAALCQRSLSAHKTSREVILKVYPGAYHAFDADGADTAMKGSGGISHRLKYNPEAATDAHLQVKEFLGKHLK